MVVHGYRPGALSGLGYGDRLDRLFVSGEHGAVRRAVLGLNDLASVRACRRPERIQWATEPFKTGCPRAGGESRFVKPQSASAPASVSANASRGTRTGRRKPRRTSPSMP